MKSSAKISTKDRKKVEFALLAEIAEFEKNQTAKFNIYEEAVDDKQSDLRSEMMKRSKIIKQSKQKKDSQKIISKIAKDSLKLYQKNQDINHFILNLINRIIIDFSYNLDDSKFLEEIQQQLISSFKKSGFLRLSIAVKNCDFEQNIKLQKSNNSQSDSKDFLHQEYVDDCLNILIDSIFSDFDEVESQDQFAFEQIIKIIDEIDSEKDNGNAKTRQQIKKQILLTIMPKIDEIEDYEREEIQDLKNVMQRLIPRFEKYYDLSVQSQENQSKKPKLVQPKSNQYSEKKTEQAKISVDYLISQKFHEILQHEYEIKAISEIIQSINSNYNIKEIDVIQEFLTRSDNFDFIKNYSAKSVDSFKDNLKNLMQENISSQKLDPRKSLSKTPSKVISSDKYSSLDNDSLNIARK